MINNLTSSVQPSELYTFAQAIEFVFKKKFMDFYCLTIAKIVTVNTDNKTLVIQPLINFKLADGTSQIPPQISNVPFGLIAGGPNAIKVPYKKDDTILVGFIDREFNSLKQDNTTAITPELIRMHNIADAFVIMNWGNGKAFTTYIEVDEDTGGINIVSNGSIDITSKGNGGIGIIAEQGNISVNAQAGNVTVTAQNNATITANSVTVTSSGDAIVNANDVKVNATTTATIIAPKVTCAKSETGLGSAVAVLIGATGQVPSTTLFASNS